MIKQPQTSIFPYKTDVHSLLLQMTWFLSTWEKTMQICKSQYWRKNCKIPPSTEGENPA